MKRSLLLLSLLLVAVASALGQSTYVEYEVQVSHDDGFDYAHEQGEVGVGAISAMVDNGERGRAYGRANVGFGVNKAVAAVSSLDANSPVRWGSAFASSRYWDYFTIDQEGLTGTVGTFTTQLWVEGAGAFDVSSSIVENPDTEIEGFWHAVLHVAADGIDYEWGGTADQYAYYAGDWSKFRGEQELFYEGDALNAYQREVTFEFVYGQPIWLDSYIQTTLRVDNQVEVAGTYDATIDLGNSAYWGGIQNVRDASGNLVDSGYGFSSLSGFDYRGRAQAVPEPGAMAALGLGVAVLLRRRKRRA